MGVTVLAPDINVSDLQFTVEGVAGLNGGRGVRFGLAAIKNVGEGAILSMLASRKTNGSIRALEVFCEHVDLRLVNKRVVESLVKAGALDSLDASDVNWATQPSTSRRARLYAAIDRALDQGSRRQVDREQGQSRLFGGDAGGDEDELPALAAATPWSEEEMLRGEKEALGLYLSGHPLERHAEGLKAAGALTSGTLATVQSGGDGTMAGIVSGCRIVKTRKGDRMAVFMLEDQTGSVEVVVYPEPYKQFASFIENDRMVVVTGRVEVDEERAKMRATEVKDLKAVTERFVKEVCVSMQAPPHGQETFRALADVFLRHRGDKRVQFELRVRREAAGPLLVKAEVPQLRVRPSDDLVLAVERICGQGSVVLR
jgi:DNA polymerase-3 subunit alpha